MAWVAFFAHVYLHCAPHSRRECRASGISARRSWHNIPITLIDRALSDNADYNNYSGMDRGSWSPNYGA